MCHERISRPRHARPKGLPPATMPGMKETLRAVFENGVFRPLERPKRVSEHREVTLTVVVEDAPLSLANFSGRVAADDADELRAIIEREFGRVDAGTPVGSAIALSVRDRSRIKELLQNPPRPTAALRAAAKRRRHRP